ncbi:MAG: hypothetical protein HYU30_11095 [Chloroflexi bacterium]|nr:hypothetical protein [Chloroflexota bacterium]
MLPKLVWERIGLSPRRRLTFTLADGTAIERVLQEVASWGVVSNVRVITRSTSASAPGVHATPPTWRQPSWPSSMIR